MLVNYNFIIVVIRYEYVNLYYIMIDWFNVFLMLVVFRKSLDILFVLLIDSYLVGDFDGVWNIFFGYVIWVGYLIGNIVYDDLIWGIIGYNSLIN